jgi:hypothetical protein
VPAPDVSSNPGQPKTIGHIYTTAYCANFVEHFNVAARIITGNDAHLDSVDHSLRAIEDDWNRRDAAMLVYQHRLDLIASVGKMLKSIPVSQAAVNELLAQAKTTTDPVRKAALQESASQLQKTIDRQKAVAYDLTSVIHVLLDQHTVEDMGETQIRNTLPNGFQYVGVHLLDDPVPKPGEESWKHNASPSPNPSGTPKAGSVEDVMQWTRQRGIIGTAESKAAVAADKVVRICNSERAPTPPPSPSPAP